MYVINFDRLCCNDNTQFNRDRGVFSVYNKVDTSQILSLSWVSYVCGVLVAV